MFIAASSDDVEDFVWRQEIETREGHALRIQVQVELVVDVLEDAVLVDEVLQQVLLFVSLLCRALLDQRLRTAQLLRVVHQRLPELVDVLKCRVFVLKDKFDLSIRQEDFLHVHPCLLHSHPLVEGILELGKLLLHFLGFVSQLADVAVG